MTILPVDWWDSVNENESKHEATRSIFRYEYTIRITVVPALTSENHISGDWLMPYTTCIKNRPNCFVFGLIFIEKPSTHDWQYFHDHLSKTFSFLYWMCYLGSAGYISFGCQRAGVFRLKGCSHWGRKTLRRVGLLHQSESRIFRLNQEDCI